MKSRIMFCNFWEDPNIHSADLKAKLLGVYYWTCPKANLIGLYCLAVEYVQIETGVDKGAIKKAMAYLEKLKYVYFYKNWVYLPNAQEKCGYINAKKHGVAAKKELLMVPSEILEHFRSLGYTIPYQYPIDSPRNQKTETRNKKQEDITDKSDARKEKMMTNKETEEMLRDVLDVEL